MISTLDSSKLPSVSVPTSAITRSRPERSPASMKIRCLALHGSIRFGFVSKLLTRSGLDISTTLQAHCGCCDCFSSFHYKNRASNVEHSRHKVSSGNVAGEPTVKARCIDIFLTGNTFLFFSKRSFVLENTVAKFVTLGSKKGEYKFQELLSSWLMDIQTRKRPGHWAI
jgi:hypothetical protein